ncbi:MAG: PEP/pyruvate-binding domain-containing protein [Byssovorax sp.]
MALPPSSSSPTAGAADAPGAGPKALDDPEVLAYLTPLGEAGKGRKMRPKRVGGKAASLGRLIRDGYPVPPGFFIDTRHFERLVEEQLPRGHDIASLIKLAATKAGVDRAARARDRILSLPLPDGLMAAIEALWHAMEKDAPWGLAVRSSGSAEDQQDTSLAGLAASVLGVRGPEAIAQAIRTVWASAYLPRALAYLAQTGTGDLGMAVVLQRMVPTEAAGVLFTAPPPGLEGEMWPADERLVNVTWGLGAPVVDGAAPADAMRISRKSGQVVSTVVAEKKRALVIGAEGMDEVPVAADRALRPALSVATLAELAALADRLEKDHHGPVDVEFAVEIPSAGSAGSAGKPGRAGKIWVLQVRPITGFGFPEGGDAQTVWSRTNVGEALPGAATPLTWSIARAFSDKGFREAFGALGCHVPRGASLVGNVHGRFYLNLSTFMQIAAQVPGLTPRALLGASGGASPAVIAALEKQIEDVSRRGFLLRLPFTATRQLARQARLEREVASFEAEIERARRGLVDLDLSLVPDDGLATTLKSASDLLDRTGTLMLSCASASLAAHLGLSTVLGRVASRRAPAQSGDGAHGLGGSGGGPVSAAEPLAQALAGGVRELDSASPGIALMRVAEAVRGDAPAREKLLAGGVKRPDDLPRGAGRSALEQFLADYGDRAVREADLATPRWREAPEVLIDMLVSALHAPPGDPELHLGRARALADREMARLETQISAPELALVRFLVERTQHFTRLRERMRTWVTRVLGMIRAIALDVDRRLRRIDPSLAEGSVFFCTYDELVAALRSGRAEIGHVVRLRRAEHARDAARPDPPATFIGRPPQVQLPPADGPRLTGLPGSGGVVEGRARVLAPGAHDLDMVEAGEILVSRTTDVGLSPLFLVAAGVVTELGGPLSHAAVVAREYGVPAVVSVPGATLSIRTGDRLRVDGDRGIVEKLDERSPQSLRRSVAPPPPREPHG